MRRLVVANRAYDIPDDWTVTSGLIDTHIHGTNGADVMDATVSSIQTIQKGLTQEGITGFLATTVAATAAQLNAVLTNINTVIQNQKPSDGAQCLGVHLEGPYLSETYRGAHKKEYLQNPSISQMKEWIRLSGNNIKMITLAPELPGALDLIDFLVSQNITVSIGHTGATFEQTQEAIRHGAMRATHFPNAMPPLHHRNPGAAGALSIDDKVMAEIIADGHHIAPEMLKFYFKAIGPERIILVSDSMRAKNMPAGDYSLGDLQVEHDHNGHVKTKNTDTIAGSTLTLPEAMRNIMLHAGATQEQVIKMATMNPLRSLHINPNNATLDADLEPDRTVFDENFVVMMTICKGEITYMHTRAQHHHHADNNDSLLHLYRKRSLRSYNKLQHEVLETPEDVGKDVAQEIADLIRSNNAAGKVTRLGLATGSTPIPVYQELIRMYREEGLDFSLVQTFNLDEYCGLGLEANVRRDHSIFESYREFQADLAIMKEKSNGEPGSYRAFMNEQLFDHINIVKKNTHFPSQDDPESYDELIARNGGIDIQLLGLGMNGHIGFNEPGTAFTSKTHVTKLDKMTRESNKRFFNDDINRVPKRAVTMGIQTILAAKRIILLATGDAKQDIVHRAITAPMNECMPASALQMKENVEVFLDCDAAFKLNEQSINQNGKRVRLD